MLTQILVSLSSLIINFINKIGYGGVFLLMALESANIPVPSEIIMPFAGYVASVFQKFNFFLLVFIGALGNLAGSIISYGLAYFIGQPLKNFFEKTIYFRKDYERAEKFFEKFGLLSVFLARLLPIIRTFISFPAGIFKVSFLPFIVLTFIGSFLWSGFLAWLGFYLGENWSKIEVYFRRFDYFILLVILVIILSYFVLKVREIKEIKNYEKRKKI